MNQTVSASFDIVIVGGGIVGTSLACALADTQLRVGLIEANPPPAELNQDAETAFDPRVSALTLASKNLLTNIGVWSLLEAYRHCAFAGMCVWDAEGTGEVTFNAPELGKTHLGYIVENSVTLNALFRRLEACTNVQVIAPASLTSLSKTHSEYQVRLENGEVIAAQLVVAADGGQSRVRTLAGINTRDADYNQYALVTTVKLSQGHQYTAWQRFLPTGPLAFLPLQTKNGDDHFCSIVWSMDTSASQARLECDEQRFAQELEFAFERRLGRVLELDRRFAFPLMRRHAETYFQPGLVLVGDAAHTIHPLAGQGVNLGLMDAAVLVEELLRATDRGLSLGDPSVLARYQRRRRAEILVMMNAVGGFKTLFGETALPVRLLRSTGMSILNRLPPLKAQLAYRAMGLSGDLPALALTAP